MDLFSLKATLTLDASDYETKISRIVQDAQKSGEKIQDALGIGETVANTGVGQTVDRATESVSSFGTTVKSILAADVVKKGITFVSSAGREAVAAASDLVEVQNVIDQTFGSSAETINQWAEMQAGAYGLSQLQAKQFAGYFGSMLQTAGINQADAAAMSMNLAELAGDVASFYNIGIQEAYQKIQSGLAGEREPLLRYGLDMGADAIGEYSGVEMKELSNEERYLARYKYLMEKTGAIQGDYMRTSDELANSQRMLENNLNRLSASFGEKLLPIMKDGTNIANSFFDTLFSQSTEGSLASIDQTAQSTAESIATTATNARAMVGVLEDYGDKAALTASEQAQWETVAGELIRQIPALCDLIDMQTGRIEGGTDALSQNIDAWEAAGKVAADTSKLEAKKGMLADLSAEISKEQGLLAIAEKQLAQNQSEVIELGTQVAQTLGEEFDGTIEGARSLLRTNAGWYAALKLGLSDADITGILSPVDEADKAITTHKENIAALQAEYSTVEESIAEDSTALGETVGALEEDVAGAFEAIGLSIDTLVSDMDQGDTAYDNAYNTGIGAANGLNDAYPAYAEAASRYTFSPKTGPGIESMNTQPEVMSFATGLNYVPYNDFLARLHEGEAVLTKSEANAWRSGDGAGIVPIDYDALGAAVARSLDGAFVDMDKEHVGQLILPTVSRGIAREAQNKRYG